MAATLRRTILFVLIVTAPLFSTSAKHKRKIDEYSGAKPKDKSCDGRPFCNFFNRVSKPFRIVDSLGHMLLASPKDKLSDRSRGYDFPTSKPFTRMTSKSHVNTVPSATPMMAHVVTKAPSTANPDYKWKKVWRNLQRLENEDCGISLVRRILGGEKTMPGEFPWLALLLVEVKRAPNLPLKTICGASLITDRYVLTAAHCLSNYRFRPKAVRLGLYHMEMNRMNCTENEILLSSIFGEACKADPPSDYEVLTWVHHSNYVNEGEHPHDIGLVRLKKSVLYTDYIRPVCLPVGELKSRWNQNNVGVNLMVAGWGMTNTSMRSLIPLKATVPLMDMEACRHFLDMDLLEGQLCVGDNKGGSPCSGDSGGPLIITSATQELQDDNSIDSIVHRNGNKSFQVGVVSWGSWDCKIQPTVFTSVESHLNWILENMEP